MRICPQCGHEFREESAVCPLCNYDTSRRLLDQEDSVDDGGRMDLLESLLGESADSSETEEDDVAVDAWSIKDLSYDDLEIVVDQYDDDGTVMVTAQGPSFAEVSKNQTDSDSSDDDFDLGEILGQSPIVPEDPAAINPEPILSTMVSPQAESESSETATSVHSSDKLVIGNDDLDDFLDGIEAKVSDSNEMIDSSTSEHSQQPISIANTSVSTELPSATSMPSSSNPILPEAKVVGSQLDETLPTASVVDNHQPPSSQSQEDNLPSAIPVTSKPTSIAKPIKAEKPSTPLPTSVPDTSDEQSLPISTPLPPGIAQDPSPIHRSSPPPPDASSRPPSGSIPSTIAVWPWPQHPSGTSPTKRREILKIALESVKSGDIAGAATALDRLGPVLGDDIDLIFHIGLLLKRLGRDNQLQSMLNSAREMYPSNEHVHRALGALI